MELILTQRVHLPVLAFLLPALTKQEHLACCLAIAPFAWVPESAWLPVQRFRYLLVSSAVREQLQQADVDPPPAPSKFGTIAFTLLAWAVAAAVWIVPPAAWDWRWMWYAFAASLVLPASRLLRNLRVFEELHEHANPLRVFTPAIWLLDAAVVGAPLFFGGSAWRAFGAALASGVGIAAMFAASKIAGKPRGLCAREFIREYDRRNEAAKLLRAAPVPSLLFLFAAGPPLPVWPLATAGQAPAWLEITCALCAALVAFGTWLATLRGPGLSETVTWLEAPEPSPTISA